MSGESVSGGLERSLAEPPPPVLSHIERQFDLRRAFPDYVTHFADWESWSDAARQRFDPIVDLRYGEAPRKRLDLFRVAAPRAPLVVFIHGGYWRTMDKSQFSFVAPPFLARGFNVAVVNYPLSPEATISSMVDSVREGCQWLAQEASRFGVDGSALHLIGWSAGAHLAVMMAKQSNALDAGRVARPPVRSALGISGIYDLFPVRHTSANAGFGLSLADAERCSPLYASRDLSIRIAIAWGALETLAFRAQSQAMAEGWDADARLEVPGCHHYRVMSQLAAPDGMLLPMALRLIETASRASQ